MLSRKHLLGLATTLPVTDLQVTTDRRERVSGTVLRGVMDGQRTAVVGSSQSIQLGALMDLVHLHLVHAPVPSGLSVDADEVTFVFLEDSPANLETEDALSTLAAGTVGGPRIRLMALSPEGALREVAPREPDFCDAARYRYAGWIDLLMRVEKGPPALMTDLVRRLDEPALRAYPMLAAKGVWSLRLEGLQVGRFTGTTGTLDVGRDGRRGAVGPERTAFLEEAGGSPMHVSTSDELSISTAADVLKRYAARMLPEPVAGAPEADHDEHALESRILRGLVPVTTRGRVQLQLLEGPDALVNWGSQFPTRWGRTSARSGRYLDALLRDGSTPWAVEIKVDRPSLGVDAYYRHAVAQAVLYRAFIRTAAPLREWFARHELDQRACRAAVVVPELQPGQQHWEDSLETLCGAFDVELIRVPRRFAGLHNVDPVRT